MNLPRKTLLIIFAFFAIYVIWGSTYLLNKIAVTQLSPLFLAAIRFITAGLLIFGIAKSMKISLAINKKQLINCIIAGFLFLAYGNGVFVWALKYVDSGFGALEASTQPLMVLILMRMIDGKKIKTSSIIGIILGIIGMYLLVSQKQLVYQENSIIGIIMIFTCVISWSFGSLFVAKAELPSNFFINTGYQMLSGGLLLFMASFIIGEEWLSPLAWTGSVKFSMILLILFGSIVAFTSFNYLLKVVSTEKVSTSAYVNPVIALLLGWYVLDEKITGQSILAAVILLTGVYFINSKKNFRTLR
ncbi:MAG: EamA family transporter [Flavobacteriales bacterium]|nr:EamA family transporter [Flavobacteriia bacterium]NCP07170.1 EamA family transporter [Flavobacteriales bacterium]PIV92514.1 MAG: EamA family transporter [Flavobacteriaceae bacterium CG17_big_fil_post_rev_8_21_14_2_50_33_15]PIY09533.1 MAG: EamA family transporter [Flavobacteriaceae bacterium CG_4_10_14_3_um_filter_33_47]PJB17319.1 MAG: EamA family transporter [Flavobacteriaceae bacterium CG_4_9_14_3_um_filter_33_16]